MSKYAKILFDGSSRACNHIYIYGCGISFNTWHLWTYQSPEPLNKVKIFQCCRAHRNRCIEQSRPKWPAGPSLLLEVLRLHEELPRSTGVTACIVGKGGVAPRMGIWNSLQLIYTACFEDGWLAVSRTLFSKAILLGILTHASWVVETTSTRPDLNWHSSSNILGSQEGRHNPASNVLYPNR